MRWNNELRKEIVDLVKRSGEGHIPSSFSIVDIIDVLYGHILNLTPETTESSKRDYFVLSKGHGCAGLFVVLEKYGYTGALWCAFYSVRMTGKEFDPNSDQPNNPNFDVWYQQLLCPESKFRFEYINIY